MTPGRSWSRPNFIDSSPRLRLQAKTVDPTDSNSALDSDSAAPHSGVIDKNLAWNHKYLTIVKTIDTAILKSSAPQTPHLPNWKTVAGRRAAAIGNAWGYGDNRSTF